MSLYCVDYCLCPCTFHTGLLTCDLLMCRLTALHIEVTSACCLVLWPPLWVSVGVWVFSVRTWWKFLLLRGFKLRLCIVIRSPSRTTESHRISNCTCMYCMSKTKYLFVTLSVSFSRLMSHFLCLSVCPFHSPPPPRPPQCACSFLRMCGVTMHCVTRCRDVSPYQSLIGQTCT